jgi:signal peptidase I
VLGTTPGDIEENTAAPSGRGGTAQRASPGAASLARAPRAYVNGTQLDEPYLASNTVTLTSVWDFETTVPAGSVFVLGDDRWEPWDSRYFGPVPDATIIGRAWLILSPSFSLTAL